MLRKDIKSMNFRELREAAYEMNEELNTIRGEFSQWKREINDMLENLDESNFSAHVRKERDNMMAQLVITPEQIKAAVYKGIDLKNVISTTIEPNGPDSDKLDKDKIYQYNGNNYYYNSLSQKWEFATDDSIYSVFQQEADGFYLKGNVVIDGDVVTLRNIKFDASSTPLIVQYSVDGTQWHDTYNPESDIYMRLSVDGGESWGDPVKITAKDGVDGEDGKDGQDGEDGKDGSDATVTAKAVSDAIVSSNGEDGLFSTFYDDRNHLFIKAEYIQTGTLAGMKFTDINGSICSLSLDNRNVVINGQSHPNAANMTLARLNSNGYELDKFFIVADAQSQSGEYLTYLIIHGNIIGWGDDTAFNPTGIWNFSEATQLNFQDKTLSCEGANIQTNGGTVNVSESGYLYANDATIQHNNSNVSMQNCDEINMNGSYINLRDCPSIDFTGSNVIGLEGYYVFSE